VRGYGGRCTRILSRMEFSERTRSFSCSFGFYRLQLCGKAAACSFDACVPHDQFAVYEGDTARQHLTFPCEVHWRRVPAGRATKNPAPGPPLDCADAGDAKPHANKIVTIASFFIVAPIRRQCPGGYATKDDDGNESRKKSSSHDPVAIVRTILACKLLGAFR